MAFEKGRQKTGGRTKGGPKQRSKKFVDQLTNAGFNYVKELALTLKDMKEIRNVFSGDPKKLTEEMKKVEEIRHYYSELRFLLPYMAPKLREKEVETTDEPEDEAPSAPISDEDLLKALGNGTETEDHSRPRNQAPVGAGDSKPQVPISPDENLSNMAGEQEEDS